MQMPRSGLPLSTASRRTGTRPRRSTSAIVAAKAPSPGSTSASARRRRLGVPGEHDLGPRAAEALRHAAQVADAVVGDRDHATGSPWWTARPRRAGRGRPPSRSARAVALNSVSAMWWLLRPRTHVEVEVEAAVVHERPEEVLEELRRQVPDALGAELDPEVEPGPAGQVHHRAGERLVERDVGVAEADDALLVAERLLERLAERDPDVLDRVVRVHVQVALAAHVEVEAGVGGERGEHVVEEADAGPDPRAALAVEVQRQGDVGLARLALDPRGAARARAVLAPGGSRAGRWAASFAGGVSPAQTPRVRPVAFDSCPLPRPHALPAVRSMPASVRAVPSACRKASFSSSLPTLTRRQRDEHRVRGHVAHQHSAPQHRGEDGLRVRGEALEQEEVRVRGVGAHAGHVGEPREEALAPRDQPADAARRAPPSPRGRRSPPSARRS